MDLVELSIDSAGMRFDFHMALATASAASALDMAIYVGDDDWIFGGEGNDQLGA